MRQRKDCRQHTAGYKKRTSEVYLLKKIMIKEKRYMAIVFIPGVGNIEYQFNSIDIPDAISYLADNVRDDFEMDLKATNIKKLQVIK